MFLHDIALIQKYFILNKQQVLQLDKLGHLYTLWNQRLNLISRKDLPNLYLHHILHSLSIAKVVPFCPSSSILDLGTGGGLPGIPLAIFFPTVNFTLIDSTGKKIHAVKDIAQNLQLNNVQTAHIRAEDLQEKYDFIVARAVSSLGNLYRWSKSNLRFQSKHKVPNGLLCLKGGDVSVEASKLETSYRIYPLNKTFQEPFFTTKVLIHLFKKK